MSKPNHKKEKITIPISKTNISMPSDIDQERIMPVLIEKIKSFDNHPFQVKDDKEMLDLVESIEEHGVLIPIIIRQKEPGWYELISGHRRKRACELAKILTIPSIVRDIDDDAATIIMVDSNIQRAHLLPSELAFAYQLKLNAIKNQGKRNDLTCSPIGNPNSSKKSSEVLALQVGQSKSQIFRYIRLTNLVPELLRMVDDQKISFNPAVELSYLKKEEQHLLIDAIEYEQSIPSLSQAQRIKKYSLSNTLSFEIMTTVLSEEKKGNSDKVFLNNSVIKKYFPKSYTPNQINSIVEKLIAQWYKKNYDK